MLTSELAFGLHHDLIGDALVLTLHGEIDAWATQELATPLTALLDLPAARVVVDLRPVTFLDASGLRLLCHIKRITDAGGRPLCLVRGHPRVWRVLLLTRMEHHFTAVDTLIAALPAALAPYVLRP
ncbi:STAS domain-containing protein [Streptomyces sp. G45]|uniref:STAS domain-containing protein n=1 Tax=Streptomyces sp. G45 TaxID=3406627 RepID=UPI003C213A92